MDRLPVLGVIGEALDEIRLKWRALLKGLVLPAVIISIVETVQQNVPDGVLWRFLFWALSTPFYVLFAIVCHRTVILGTNSLPIELGLFWSERETRFLGWTVALIVMGWALGLLLALAAPLLPGEAHGTQLPWLPIAVSGLIAMYFYTRLSLVFPATAIDQIVGFDDAWKLSSGNGIRLVAALLLPAALFVGFVVLLSLPFNVDGIFFFIILELAAFLFFALSICILSVAYRMLSGIDLIDDAT